MPDTANLEVEPPEQYADPEGDADPAKQIEAMQESVRHQMIAQEFIAMAREL